MKNHLIVSSREVPEYIETLWKTEEFRYAHATPGFPIHALVQKLGEFPLGFYEYSDKLEWSHFSTWWRLIPYREYSNPYVHDLYLLHEFYHAAILKYWGSLFRLWALKMNYNEVNSSLMSEVFIYFLFRDLGVELRPHTFSEEIWADRFLRTISPRTPEDTLKSCEDFSSIKQLYYSSPFLEIRDARYDIMREDDPMALDEIERGIFRYRNQNRLWAKIWKKNRDVVEQSMRSLILDYAGGSMTPAQEIERFERMLREDFGPYTEHGIPFYAEAVGFAEIYNRNNEVYTTISTNYVGPSVPIEG